MADEPSFPDLESLYCSHHGWLQGWLRRRLGNACDADVLLPPAASDPSHHALEQAAEWFALLDSGEATEADRRRWDAWLAVYEGAVEVRTAAGATAVIPAGWQTRYTREALGTPEPADPAREAWTRGLLLARNIPLASLVQELRRYHPGHLGLAPELADLPVYGGYPIDDPAQTLAMLESVLPVRVKRSLPWWVSIEPRDDPAAAPR
ncbi:Fe2+-dicitrate sensor, membrane component [plant metagenome]|uniref:Fe2+-dicitrate sensor, membrane component n=1 Tax=plant metagenome TaxID=1297885 RepID=A0A484QKG9_9ZZZZ